MLLEWDIQILLVLETDILRPEITCHFGLLQQVEMYHKLLLDGIIHVLFWMMEV